VWPPARSNPAGAASVATATSRADHSNEPKQAERQAANDAHSTRRLSGNAARPPVALRYEVLTPDVRPHGHENLDLIPYGGVLPNDIPYESELPGAILHDKPIADLELPDVIPYESELPSVIHGDERIAGLELFEDRLVRWCSGFWEYIATILPGSANTVLSAARSRFAFHQAVISGSRADQAAPAWPAADLVVDAAFEEPATHLTQILLSRRVRVVVRR